MCLIALALQQHPEYPLVLAANRDEFYQRPSQPADWWADAPQVLGGRDLQGGGTWLGVTRSGRLAALTNYRAPRETKPNAPSRGALTADFLRGDASPAQYLVSVDAQAERYNGFNLLVGQGQDVFYYSNRQRPGRALPPGVYGLSNALLDTPWPKTQRLCQAMTQALAAPTANLVDALLAALADPQQASDADLPETGIGIEWEKLLSSAKIVSPTYGTRCSTIILFGRDGTVSLEDHSFAPDSGVQRHQFQITR